MKRLLTLVAFFATLQASAQQVNPVPDYVFSNRMSAGRNTVTDTAAYFSIGPRYGATRGMMPPMVVDTASFSGNKRNGLLIFSVQKNKFLYWDSVGVKWAEMAGTAGTALTSADTAALLSTRAWRQKGIDSLAAIRIAGSGTTNYLPKFTATRTIGNSQIFDNGSNIGIGVTPQTWWGSRKAVEINSGGAVTGVTVGFLEFYGNSYLDGSLNYKYLNNGTAGIYQIGNLSTPSHIFYAATSGTAGNNVSFTQALTIMGNGRVVLNSGSDAGFQFDVVGTSRTGTHTINTNGQTISIGTYYGSNSNGRNLYIGDGGTSSIGAVGETFKGGANVGVGYQALMLNTTGYQNTAIGTESLYFNTTGYYNSSLGMHSLHKNTTGYENVALGSYALFDNTTGYRNIGIGMDALNDNVSGYSNVAIGQASLSKNTTGYENVALGGGSLINNFNGDRNVAIGRDAGALINSGGNNDSSNNSIFIGYDARSNTINQTNEIVIGYQGRGNGSNTVTIGNSSTTQNYFYGALNTSAPSGGSVKPWKLGEAATVSPTSPNRTIRVEIDGVVYYLHAKTTND